MCGHCDSESHTSRECPAVARMQQAEQSFTVACEWFARCTNETSQAAGHPVLGPVPICDRCADMLDIVPEYTLTPAN